jgi:hypothetical protein
MTTSSPQDPASTRAVLETPYTLASVTHVASPIADDTRDWHSYVIVQGTNRIVGHRPGSAQSVRIAAENLVLRLNERRSFRPGRKNLVISGPTTSAES